MDKPCCSKSLPVINLPPLPDETDNQPIKLEIPDLEDDDDTNTVVNEPISRRVQQNTKDVNANNTNPNIPYEDGDQGCTTGELILPDERTDEYSERESSVTAALETGADKSPSDSDSCVIIDDDNLISDDPSQDQNYHQDQAQSHHDDENPNQRYDQHEVQGYPDDGNPNPCYNQDPGYQYDYTNLPSNHQDENPSFQHDELNPSFEFKQRNPGFHFNENASFQFSQNRSNPNPNFQFGQNASFQLEQNYSCQFNQNPGFQYEQNRSFQFDQRYPTFQYGQIPSFQFGQNSSFPNGQDQSHPYENSSYHYDQNHSFQYYQQNQQSYPEGAYSESSDSNRHHESLPPEERKECYGTEMFTFLHECVGELSKEIQEGPYKDNLRTCLIDLRKAQKIITSEERRFHQDTMHDHHNNHNEYYCNAKRESRIPVIEIKDEVETGEQET